MGIIRFSLPCSAKHLLHMSTIRFLFFALFAISLFSACDRRPQQKGISLDQLSQTDAAQDTSVGVSQVITRPSTVLLTAHPDHRLVTVYKLIQETGRKGAYIGTNHYYHSHSDSDEVEEGLGNRWNAWHGHYMPGIEALQGANLLHISHYNMKTKARNDLFEHPVWINTLYYPAFETDTLNGKPVVRDYYLVSAYDEDTNKDSIVNFRDLRHFYHFDLEGKKRTQLIPPNYSVVSSEYDPANDAMYIFASLDANGNGRRDTEEPVHVFWISLKAPMLAERLY